MNHYHDPLKHVKFLRQSLSQDKKPMGIFVSAGCPLAVQMPDPKNWPLIPDVARLTKFVHSELKAKEGDEKNTYDTLLDELQKTGKNIDNVEDILSFVRGLKEVSSGSSVRGFSEADLIALEKNICNKIVSRLDVTLPDQKSPYHKLASWVSIDREKPVEIFTTNYDLLVEQAFEELSIPYFDGFVGSRQSFFDLRALEDNLIPKHWTRLWKIHGSINWFQKENKEVFRSSRTNEIDASHLIYPSHLKYEQSRKMPYLALIDQLNRFLRQPSSLLIISGYSFSDYHLNDAIVNALKANPNTMVIALLFDTLTYEDSDKKIKERYPHAVELATRRPNLAIWGYDEAIIGTVRGQWKLSKEMEPQENLGQCIVAIEKKKKDEKGEETTEVLTSYQLKLGDFAKFGDFLQALIGYNQTKSDEK